jgi:transposase
MEDTIRMPLLKTFLDRCRSDHAEFAQVEGLLIRGWTLLRQHLPALLPGWLTALTGSGVKELQAFAVGIDRDYDAIRAALELPQSNGQVEGQVNRLKTLKRSMYGRAGLGLLRARVLHRSGRWGTAVTKS